MTTDYLVELYSEGEEKVYRGVAELKEIQSSIYVYGPSNNLMAVFEQNDIKKIVPISQND